MKDKRKIIILILVLLSTVFLCMYIYKWEVRDPLFEINFFSLNRGRSVFIRSLDNQTILIGGGQNTDTIRELTKVMPFYSKKIDYVFIPSSTPAQIGGLIEIVNRYEIEEIIMPKILATSTVLSQLMKTIRKKKIHVREVEKGDEIGIEGLHIKVLFPNIDFKFNKTSLPELGLEISFGKTAVYLIGNLSKTIQKYISKEILVNNQENIIEFYNSASNSKVSLDLTKKLEPKFIFSTKEKTTRWVSGGSSFTKEY